MMSDVFSTISLSISNPDAINQEALLEEMRILGLTRNLTSTEGYPVRLPEYCFAGTMQSEDRMKTHRHLHRGLNNALIRLGLHGRFFILVSSDADWSCCNF
jgi:hypothetical protein